MSERAQAGPADAEVDPPQESADDVGPLDADMFGVDLRQLEEDHEAEEAWRPPSHAVQWVHEKMVSGVLPLDILGQLMRRNGGTDGNVLPSGLVKLLPSLDNATLWHIIIQLLGEPPRRSKLSEYNTLDDAVHLIRRSQRIVVLTGAGISVSCGIPDFRSKHGVYARLHTEFPDLPDPQAMFDIDFFRRDPRPFFKFAKEIYPGQFRPSKAHAFIAMLERERKLLRNYTQNIDTLELAAGIGNIIQCHGSFATATCCVCRARYSCDEIKADIFAQRIPYCTRCTVAPSTETAAATTPAVNGDAGVPPPAPAPVTASNVIKPDIVFFGESLPAHFHDSLAADKSRTDLLIVMGSSLKVRPVALIPDSLPAAVPQIVINNQPLEHISADIELIGDCDTLVDELALRLGQPYDGRLCDEVGRRPLDGVQPDHPEFMDGHRARDAAALIKHELASGGGGAHEPPRSKRPRLCDTGDAADDDADRRHRTPEVERDEFGELAQCAARTDRRGPVRIPAGCYVSVSPHRHLFHGADVYYSDGEEDEEDNGASSARRDSGSSTSSDSDSEVETRSLDRFPVVVRRRRKDRSRSTSA